MSNEKVFAKVIGSPYPTSVGFVVSCARGETRVYVGEVSIERAMPTTRFVLQKKDARVFTREAAEALGGVLFQRETEIEPADA